MARGQSEHVSACKGSRPRLRPTLALTLMLISPLILGACDSLFYQPDSKLYWAPEQFGLWYEEVRFSAADGTRLAGWFLPAKGKALGTVVHFHGNAANISNHLYAVRWLPHAGYNVFLFDYRGYGESQGRATREGMLQDGVAAIETVRKRPDVDPQRLVILGQSLGGAIAIGALARAGTEGVKALVIEGGFASYREVVRLILKRSWISWPFQYPVAYLLFSDQFSPLDDLPRIASVPLLAVHGMADQTVPIEEGRHLFEAFPGSDKAFWPIPAAQHMEVFGPPGSPWREQLLQWMEKKLGKVFH